jgi:hypothetical protein
MTLPGEGQCPRHGEKTCRAGSETFEPPPSPAGSGGRPTGYDTIDLYFRALPENILFAPGRLFSRNGGFTSSLRINAGTWNLRIERAIRRLGAMLAEGRAAVSRGFEAPQR